MSEKLEERWPKRWHCIEARDNEFAEQSGPGKPIMAVRNGVNIGTVDLCPKCFETLDHHAAKPEQPPFTPGQRVRTNDGRVLDVSRCEKRHVPGKLRWVVDDLNGERAFADECELFEGVKPEVRYACTKLAAVGDTVKFAGIVNSEHRKVIKVKTDGIIESESLDGTNVCIDPASSLEFVPDVTATVRHWQDAHRGVEVVSKRDYDAVAASRDEWERECESQRKAIREGTAACQSMGEQLTIAKLLLGQCDNRLFLVGKLELRRKQSGWSVFDPVANMFDDVRFADPIAAYQWAKTLLEAFGKEAGAT